MNNILIKIKTFLKLVSIGYITPRKLLNFIKVRSSLYLKRPKVWGMPYSLSIEPTNFCNLKCPLCYVGKGKLGRESGFLDIKLYKKIMDQTSPYLFNMLLSIWGEPFLNKNIYEMIEYAKKKKVRLTIMTNGHFFDTDEKVKRLVDSGLDNLLTALDGADQETLIKYRKNANFDKVVDGIKRIVKEKERRNTDLPNIELQFVVMKHNEHQIEKMKQLAKELKVDTFVLKTAIVTSLEEANSFLPKDKSLTRYKEGLKRKRIIKNSCNTLWTDGTIYWDGTMIPCCIDYSAKHPFGNLKDASFKAIWNSNIFINFRKQILKDKGKIAMCKTCPGGDDNFDIERIKIEK